jgi:hypothetical protein
LSRLAHTEPLRIRREPQRDFVDINSAVIKEEKNFKGTGTHRETIYLFLKAIVAPL